jgi:hypothetical protein
MSGRCSAATSPRTASTSPTALCRPPSCRTPSKPDQARHKRGVNLACNTLPYKIAALREAHLTLQGRRPVGIVGRKITINEKSEVRLKINHKSASTWPDGTMVPMAVVLRLLPLAGEARLQRSGHVSSLNRARFCDSKWQRPSLDFVAYRLALFKTLLRDNCPRRHANLLVGLREVMLGRYREGQAEVRSPSHSHRKSGQGIGSAR